MVKNTSFFQFAAVSLLLVGCTTTPEKSDLAQMDRDDLRSTVVGNTFTYVADYGRWAEYMQSLESGHARAWGTWGSESVTAEYTVSSDGEWCVIYSGEYEWAGPEHKYCSVLYTDAEGNFYSETVTNSWKPAREGRIREVEIRSGDKYGLASE